MATVDTFMGVIEDYSKSEIVILPVPYDKTSTWQKGADKGPKAIMDASLNLEVYDIVTNTEVFKKGIFTADKIGFDGWTKDAVVALPPLDDESLKEFLTELHLRLFGSTYLADAVKLPVTASKKYSGKSLDLPVSAAELHQWLIKEDPWLRSFLGDIRWSQAHLGNSAAKTKAGLSAGVYFSDEPGLVVWSFPRGDDLSQYRRDAYRFFVDSDLILGAVASDELVWIVGRERVEPSYRLPPLRTDMVMILAAQSAASLAQSYERNRIFAGRLTSGWDWAPVFLSDPLLHTEFGSLLNITDQLLKSWSLEGQVEYVNFPYPKPAAWPGFPESLVQVARKYGSILFNWNTLGAGYRVEMDDGVEVIASSRLGALPVIYRAGPDEQIPVSAHEEKAYDYFANLGNPDLARVVQYTTLYQIFRGLNIGASINSSKSSQVSGIDILKGFTKNLLQKIEYLTEDDLDVILKNADHRIVEDLNDMSSNELRDLFDGIASYLVDLESVRKVYEG